jgi:Zn-dependent protease
LVGSLNLIAGLGVALGFLFGIVGHHWAHARVAIALGDRTPKLMGRATLRPKAHVDTLGSIIMPIVFIVVAIFRGPAGGMMFGWGKPQSFNPRAFRKPRRDMILVALAGPAATGLIAAASAALSRAELHNNIGRVFGYIMLVNSFLTVVELLPIPGRDGGRILVRFLSPHAAMKFEEFVQYDLIFLVVLFLLLETVVVNMTAGFLRLIGAA